MLSLLWKGGARIVADYSRFAVAAVACGLSTAALGQGAGDLLGAFGGLIAAAQAQAAQEAWSRQPELRRYCLERALGRQGYSISRMIQGGVGPDDPRIQRVRGECSRFEPGALKVGYRCTAADEPGSVGPTWCDQRFGRQDSYGRVQYLDARTAIDVHFNGGVIALFDLENEQGRRERADRAAGAVRQTELSQLRSSLEIYRSSGSEVVRGHSQSLLQRVVLAANNASGLSDAALEALRQDQQRLAQLEQLELARMAAVDKLSALKTRVEKKAEAGPTELKQELSRLNAQYLAALKPPVIPSDPPSTLRRVEKVSPTFDCGKAKAPLEIAVCSDQALSRLDVELFQPYYVLRHLRPELRDELKREAVENTRRVLGECRLPGAGTVTPAAVKAAVPCVARAYRAQRDKWRARVVAETHGLGRDEAVRPGTEHLQLEQALQTAGYLTSDAVLDGVYGAKTRAAITAFQTSEALPADGLMTAATAERLKIRAAAGPTMPVDTAPSGAATEALASLHNRFSALEARLDEAAAQRVRLEQLNTKLDAAEKTSEAALAQALPESTRSRVDTLLQDLRSGRSGSDPAVLGRLALDFDNLKPGLDDAVALAKATTPKNRFLIEGDPDEIIVLYNDGGRAPSVIKNIKGELVFEMGRTAACQPNGGTPSGPFVRAVNVRLQKWGQSLAFPLGRCNLAALASTDLVVVTRSQVLKERSADVVTLLSALDSGLLAPMFTVTGDEVKAAEQAQAVKVLEVEADVEKEGRPGFAIVVIENGSRVVCEALPRDERDAHELLLKPTAARLANELNGPPTFVATSADAAFLAAKRGQCGAIYAGSGDLRDLVTAMRRDGIGFRYLSVWIDPEEIAGAKKAVADARTKESQQQADRRRRVEDDRRVEEEKQKDDAVVRARKQAELQQQNGALARAFEGLLRAEMKDYLEGRSDKAARKYPPLAAWYDEQLGNRWELVSVDTNLADYGMADFKGRSLETAFARTAIKLRNRIRGEYAEHCFVTGFISDTEFSMDREPFLDRCEDAGPGLAEYARAERFVSRWLVR
ncbi:peptidoglycan-binding protein [Enterovirga sp. CN4-39]|uniref:peptidoglycan-binding protein n=1 Tax=Enterovirga sp. CN4-39 TaxID=3400910 RepID=UPI003C0CA98D